MTRVYPLPSDLKSKLIELFSDYSPEVVQDGAPVSKGYHFARLLLGCESVPQKILIGFDNSNFSLTRECVEKLGINTTELSREMARMLAQLHMTTRNDARGIQVVLGANITSTVSKSREPRVWVIGFNHVKEFNFTISQIPLLVEGFFATEVYFPRARPTNLLYKTFAEAYLKECSEIGEVAEQLGHYFIEALEKEQLYRDKNMALQAPQAGKGILSGSLFSMTLA